MKFERIPEISSVEVEWPEDKNWKDVPKIGHDTSADRIDYHFKKHVARLNREEQKEKYDFSINGIFRFIAKEEANGFQSCSFIVQFHIRIDVMTQTVHSFPLTMSETCERQTILEEVCFMVHEIVTDSNHWYQEKRCAHSNYVRPVWLFLLVNWVVHQTYTQYQQAK